MPPEEDQRTWRDFVDSNRIESNQSALRDKFLRFQNKNPWERWWALNEEQESRINAALTRCFQGAVVLHNTRSESEVTQEGYAGYTYGLRGLLEEGRFRSRLDGLTREEIEQREDLRLRRAVDELLFGDRGKSPGIIFGMLNDGSEAENKECGKIRIVLRDSVRTRATITRRDSLKGVLNLVELSDKYNIMTTDEKIERLNPVAAMTVAVPLEAPSALLLPKIAPDYFFDDWTTLHDIRATEYLIRNQNEYILQIPNYHSLPENERTQALQGFRGLLSLRANEEKNYFEVQIHGGVTGDDIEEIQIPSEHPLSQAEQRLLENGTISFRGI